MLIAQSLVIFIILQLTLNEILEMIYSLRLRTNSLFIIKNVIKQL